MQFKSIASIANLSNRKALSRGKKRASNKQDVYTCTSVNDFITAAVFQCNETADAPRIDAIALLIDPNAYQPPACPNSPGI